MRETVLVVDDEPCVRAVVACVLKRLGFDVIIAEDGARGLEMFHAHRTKVRLVVTDVAMPRVSGPEMVNSILAMEPSTKVLFMSGYDGNALASSGLQDHPCLLKPFGPSAVVDAVAQFVEPISHPLRVSSI